MADTPTAAASPQLTDETRRALEALASGQPPEVTAAIEEREKEWGTWVAVQSIYFGGALAANVGDALPNANVEQYKYDQLGWVAKRTSKAGKDALATRGIEV